MRPVATDVVWSVRLLVTSVSPATTAAPIDEPFGGGAQAGPRNHVLGGVRVLSGKGAIWGSISQLIVKYRAIRRAIDILNLIRYVAAAVQHSLSVLQQLVMVYDAICLYFAQISLLYQMSAEGSRYCYHSDCSRTKLFSTCN